MSRSLLWRLQRNYFERQGPAAWSRGEVPHYVTSSPLLAGAYAQLVLGFLRDSCSIIDPAQPLYIVELGAGSGRLGFHFLRRLRPPPEHRCTYVLTDFAEANLAAWRAHPSLAGWLESGALDLGRFDAQRDTTLVLERAGLTLAPGALRNPLVVIANYVLDSLPMDCFSVRAGRLHEWLTGLVSSVEEPDLDDPAILGRARLGFEQRPVTGPRYYGEPTLDTLLDEHRQLPDRVFTFPSAGLACLQRLSALAGGRMLLLTADKAEAPGGTPTGPEVQIHGSLSMRVNYQVVARWVERAGGQVLRAPHRARALEVCAFVLGQGGGPCRETRRAFADHVELQGPDDWFVLKGALERAAAGLTLPEMLAWVRFGGHDPRLLAACLPSLERLAPAASAAEKEDLRIELQRAWHHHFPIGEPEDLAFELGLLASVIDAWPDAQRFFEESLRLHGPDPGTLYNLALCHVRLGRLDAARARLDELLAGDPAHEAAREMREKLGP
jgi:hypothetical protein